MDAGTFSVLPIKVINKLGENLDLPEDVKEYI